MGGDQGFVSKLVLLVHGPDRCKESGDWQRSNLPRRCLQEPSPHGPWNKAEHPSPLSKIVEASSGMGLAFGTREVRQEHACQNGDDGNDHQEFDQGEGLGPLGG